VRNKSLVLSRRFCVHRDAVRKSEEQHVENAERRKMCVKDIGGVKQICEAKIRMTMRILEFSQSERGKRGNVFLVM